MMNAWIPGSLVKCIPSECSGDHAASLHAEDSMHFGAMDPDCMQWSPCSEAQCISIECSGFYAASHKASRLNVWIPFIVIEFIVLHEACSNASRLNAVESMQCEEMEPIECSGFYAA